MKTNFRQKSIRFHLQSSYLFIIGLLSIPTILLLCFLLPTASRYHEHIGYITDARDIMELSETQLKTELWEIVAGNQTYEKSSHGEIMDTISTKLSRLQDEAETYQSTQQLDAATHLMETLNTYITRLGTPSYHHSSTTSSGQILREMYSVSDLLNSVLQEYIYIQTGLIGNINNQLRTSAISVTLLSILLLLTIIAVVVQSIRNVQQDIQDPINQLETMAVQLAGGNLDARVSAPSLFELTTLTKSLNTMANQLGELIDHRVQDQLDLRKAEMRALQAQITPHFIYNTLDTIVWLTQQNENETVVDITMALTQFFRISLSGGNDYITVKQEFSHIESYLKIQQVRYASLMHYQISIDDGILTHRILKLLLQPLVENAIYHGIKRKRSRGTITIEGYEHKDDRTMTFSVSDTGMGMTKERLAQVLEALSSDTAPSTGFGLYNVNQRIQLYYDNPGLNIKSTYRMGTTISFTIPVS